MERALLRVVAMLRLVAFALVVTTVAAEAHSLRHEPLAWTLVAVAGAVTLGTLYCTAARPGVLTTAPAVATELVVAAALLALDGFVFRVGHVGSTEAGLAGSWPIAGVLTAGIAFGPWVGLASGVAMGIAHLVSSPLNGIPLSSFSLSKWFAFMSALVLDALYGVAVGFAVRLIRSYDDSVARARVRDEVGRTLHDGMLQTLAAVERRSDDPHLVALARRQERELRGFLSTIPPSSPVTSWRRPVGVASEELAARLRALADRHLDPTATSVTVTVADDVPAIDPARAEALLGAASEALANVAKHASATRVTVYGEPGEGSTVFCSVKDDGVGFDPTATSEGFGLAQSVRARLEHAGGRVVVHSGTGRGTEVQLWV